MKLLQLTDVKSVQAPIGIPEARQHLRIEHQDEDSYLSGLIAGSLSIAEQYIDGIIADREYELLLDVFPAHIALPLRPVDSSSITISYTDDEGNPQTIDSFDTASTAYSLTIGPDIGESWPSVTPSKDNIRVRFTAGYAAATGEVPGAIKSALLMIVGTLYDQREDHSAGVVLKSVPTSSSFLLAPYRKVTV